jgi:23S rRNA pseudouridine2605 synthase
MAEERLQKIIARSGLCSRREAERMVQEGRVTVNGHVATIGDRADPITDHVKVDGKSLKRRESPRYLLLYKPRQVMTTCDDPEERTTVIDLVSREVRERVFPVGRLDYHSEGLIILTNDGDLAARVSHPRYGVVREYLVKVRGDLNGGEVNRLMAGTMVDGRLVKPVLVSRHSGTRGGNSWWKIQVTEGRTHEVRELFFRVGHHVQRLRRMAIGPIRDDRIRPGEFRHLTDGEVRSLTSLRPSKRRPTGSGRSKRADRQPAGPGAKRRSARSSDARKKKRSK